MKLHISNKMAITKGLQDDRGRIITTHYTDNLDKATS